MLNSAIKKQVKALMERAYKNNYFEYKNAVSEIITRYKNGTLNEDYQESISRCKQVYLNQVSQQIASIEKAADGSVWARRCAAIFSPQISGAPPVDGNYKHSAGVEYCIAYYSFSGAKASAKDAMEQNRIFCSFCQRAINELEEEWGKKHGEYSILVEKKPPILKITKVQRGKASQPLAGHRETISNRWKKQRKIFIAVIVLLAMSCCGLQMNLSYTREQLSYEQEQALELQAQAEKWEENYNKMKSSRDGYRDRFNATVDELDFWGDYAVIVTENGEKYHTYGCQYIKGRSFWIYNVAAAIGKGYRPCSVCNPPRG